MTPIRCRTCGDSLEYRGGYLPVGVCGVCKIEDVCPKCGKSLTEILGKYCTSSEVYETMERLGVRFTKEQFMGRWVCPTCRKRLEDTIKNVRDHKDWKYVDVFIVGEIENIRGVRHAD